MVRHKVRTSILPIMALVLACSFAMLAQSSTSNIPTPENWKQATPNISQADLTGQKDVVRQERSAVFDDKRSDAPRLDSLEAKSSNKQGAFPPYFARIPAIPAQESDTIIVGTVTAVQSYFSNDHTHLYTEFTVSVDQQIKDNTHRTQPGGTISIVIPGGRLRLADGRTIAEKPAYTNFTIAKDSRYVFFLRNVAVGQYFSVVKNWELKNGGLIPTAHEDQMDEREGKSQYSSMTEGSFIQAARQAVKSGQDEQ